MLHPDGRPEWHGTGHHAAHVSKIKRGEPTMRVIFDAKYRDDGSMFVTSANIPSFSAVAKVGDWNLVFELAAADTKMNGNAIVSPTQHHRND